MYFLPQVSKGVDLPDEFLKSIYADLRRCELPFRTSPADESANADSAAPSGISWVDDEVSVKQSV